jgi:Do/DeqQ family serine protease
MNMKLKQLLLITVVSAVSAIGSVWIYGKLIKKGPAAFVQQTNSGKLPVNYVGYTENAAAAGAPVDLTKAADAAVPAVVHIKTKTAAKKVTNELPRSRNRQLDNWFEQFFEFGPQIIPEQKASGSGVLIAEDGYIVTNNHVISDGAQGVAEEITVTLHNKKSFKARLIGRDPSSDLAVLKIDGNGFPFMLYGNSDNVRLGQWVLAVGYPLTLETTVTAGIISAKGRTIGINSRQSQTPVEAFIQTDAAINQGNSGGALINTDGQLIGINSAILAPSGTYAGYGFAIPVNISRKIVNDLIQYGDVKRGFLGISYIPIEEENEKEVKKAGVTDGQGVYVNAVPTDGAASQAGIKKGDVITKVNSNPVSSGLEMSGQIAQFKPGDKVPVAYIRSGKEFQTSVVLKESAGKLEVVAVTNINEKLGGILENLSKAKAGSYGIEGAVVVKEIVKGGALSRIKMEEGFVITSVNGRDITTVEELSKLISGNYGTIRLEGFYPGYDGTYTYPLNLGDD